MAFDGEARNGTHAVNNRNGGPFPKIVRFWWVCNWIL
jgi:hypothetical protein